MIDLARKILVAVWDVVESVTFALALVVISYLFFFQPGEVHGTSSFPTWQENERFITSKIAYTISEPQRGDFVVMVSPRNADIDFIKRVVGLPKETIELKSCQVYINGSLLVESYLEPDTCTGPESFLQSSAAYQIPDNHYFLLGDNREHSSDSRDFGPVPKRKIIGKVIFRYWPLDRLGPVP